MVHPSQDCVTTQGLLSGAVHLTYLPAAGFCIGAALDLTTVVSNRVLQPRSTCGLYADMEKVSFLLFLLSLSRR